jgi:hypothetical protein
MGAWAMAVVILMGGARTTLVKHHHRPPIGPHERHGQDVTASGWSGYALTGTDGSVTKVVGSWTVPAADCTMTPNGQASFWLGIDGYNSNTVEQIGTDSDCTNGVASYYAWYEFYPHGAYTINNFPVNVGDVISAEVTGNPQFKQYTVTISDAARPHQPPFSVTTRMPSARASSAEWIAEAPFSGGTLALTDFGTVSFKNCQATINGKLTDVGPFSNSNVYAITSVSKNGIPKAVPSPIESDNTDFSITWLSAGP